MMILEIEYWKQNTLLMGKAESVSELRRNLEKAESLCDPATDNFVPLFCRMYHWEEIDTDECPDYVYDRDIQKLIKPNYDDN